MTTSSNVPPYTDKADLLDISDSKIKAKIANVSFDPNHPEVTFLGIIRADFVVKADPDEVTILSYDFRIYTDKNDKKLVGRAANTFFDPACSFKSALVANLPKDHYPASDTVWLTMKVKYRDKQGNEHLPEGNCVFDFGGSAAD